jgi:hypothetical protein
MFGDLRTCTEHQLLEFFQTILAKPGPLTARDETEIRQIEEEIERRESCQKQEC